MPGQSWPADGGQHIDVVHLTTEDVKNSSSCQQLEVLHGNSVALGACLPNRRSIFEHRTNETRVQPLIEPQSADPGRRARRFCLKALNLTLRMTLFTWYNQERVHEIWTPNWAVVLTRGIILPDRDKIERASSPDRRCLLEMNMCSDLEAFTVAHQWPCSPGVTRTDIFFQTTARLISADARATVIQERIVSKQGTWRGDSTRYVTEKIAEDPERNLGERLTRSALKVDFAIDAGADAALTQV